MGWLLNTFEFLVSIDRQSYVRYAGILSLLLIVHYVESPLLLIGIGVLYSAAHKADLSPSTLRLTRNAD